MPDQFPGRTYAELNTFFSQFDLPPIYDEMLNTDHNKLPRERDILYRKDKALENVLKLNNPFQLESLIEAIVDPREFINQEESVGDAVKYINRILAYEGYKLEFKNKAYRIIEVPIKSHTDKPKSGGRPKDPSLPRKKFDCAVEYWKLTKLKKKTEIEALKILAKQHDRSHHTIDKWIKTAPLKRD